MAMKYETKINFDFENTMSIMIQEIEKGSTVLEFGPASGRLTQFLKEEMDCKVYIVEIDEESGKIAASFAEEALIGGDEGNIENYQWLSKFQGIRFDYILFADVLEHLFHPEEVLEKALSVLKPTGYIIVSLPNIAHNSIIIDLLENKFEYKNTGLLDNTHVKFWTYDNIENMMNRLGLKVDIKYATYTQVGFNEFPNTYEQLKNINPRALKARKLGEVYQYVYKVTPSESARGIDQIHRYSDYYYAQFFYDSGEGGKAVLVPDGRTHRLTIPIREKTGKLRFDPLNKRCLIKVLRVEGEMENGSEAVKPESTNATMVTDQVYYFNHDDSQIFYLVGDYRKIVIEYRVMDCDRIENQEYIDQLVGLCDHKRITIEQKENYICEQREKMKDQDTKYLDQIRQKDQRIKDLEERVTDLTPYRNFVAKIKVIHWLYRLDRKIKQKTRKDRSK